MYCYAQACRTMKEEDRINEHIAMYDFFDTTTRILTPDNLKAWILSNRKNEDPVSLWWEAPLPTVMWLAGSWRVIPAAASAGSPAVRSLGSSSKVDRSGVYMAKEIAKGITTA